MSSNLVIAKRLLGQYGLFQPGRNGNFNVNAAGAQVPYIPNAAQGGVGATVPANLTQNGQPGAAISNGVYLGQGISSASFDSGPLFFQEASGWSRIGIAVRADVPGNAWGGLTATIYGTFDWDTACGALTTYSATTGLRTSGNETWFPIPIPSLQSGDAGTWKNPLVVAGDAFWINSNGMLAIRILVSTLVSGAVLFGIVWEP